MLGEGHSRSHFGVGSRWSSTRADREYVHISDSMRLCAADTPNILHMGNRPVLGESKPEYPPNDVYHTYWGPSL
jgi:hypothetical protein